MITSVVIEGFDAKREYIALSGNFHFSQDRANFCQTDLFWHEKHCTVIVFCWSGLCFHSRNDVCKNSAKSLGVNPMKVDVKVRRKTGTAASTVWFLKQVFWFLKEVEKQTGKIDRLRVKLVSQQKKLESGPFIHLC